MAKREERRQKREEKREAGRKQRDGRREVKTEGGMVKKGFFPEDGREKNEETRKWAKEEK